ncbi:MAG: hypothetical protein CMN73_12510 [Sphingomonas sp.]|nr:hypothetical protein [Sphingomonas sp.]|tara:strand:+ start:123 stop:740 length:618 start_codon:yes stop_codon:yes gene_type:complete
MLLLALLALVQDVPPPPETAVDAERAMAAAALTEGHWSALMRFAADDAGVFTDRLRPASLQRLRGEPDQPIHWWPTASYVSCDGGYAINTGTWLSGTMKGDFLTLWRREPDGEWRWTLDFVGSLTRSRDPGARLLVETASCAGDAATAFRGSGGSSPDRTLRWDRQPTQIGEELTVSLWDGERYRVVANANTRHFDVRRRHDSAE